ncbi:putative nucleotidyltransferase-like protein [Winogradskyella epiphytica]|uniref:Putative nucleotidyltransferase-like protein n=1 Tax=Winogradskyella epiphytica TaxID=262005 RepID=A0A2V4YFN6_9FLAO|nr:nucleotidyltransferase family protein [Winogradskyella epiphytica]PYE82723.1 putative nucleotidyltransferase-like protein [Winogradskyella epiphytica]GGW53212.1 hypothetical protein GCM10008085_00280 [Winogradskyella epiphytica]
MENYAITYRYIADILSFETAHDELKATLSDPAFDWDAIVIHGSRHLVLPALYCRLKSKKLLHLLPPDLIVYLEEITALNRTRNTTIINEIHQLVDLFDKHEIDYIFLKGAALLVFGCFEDIAERMVGDIDLLIPKEQISIAHHLLCNNGYYPNEQTLEDEYFDTRHLPRLKSNQFIAAVELHSKLFDLYNFEPLLPKSIFKEKIIVQNINIPSHQHLLMHNILSFQINDDGTWYNSISFRAAYDTIILQRNYLDSTYWYKDKYFKSYFSNTSIFFKDITKKTQIEPNIFSKFYIFTLKHPRFNKFWFRILKILNYIPTIISRTLLFMSNKSYRMASFQRRKQLYNRIKSILKNL